MQQVIKKDKKKRLAGILLANLEVENEGDARIEPRRYGVKNERCGWRIAGRSSNFKRFFIILIAHR